MFGFKKQKKKYPNLKIWHYPLHALIYFVYQIFVLFRHKLFHHLEMCIFLISLPLFFSFLRCTVWNSRAALRRRGADWVSPLSLCREQAWPSQQSMSMLHALVQVYSLMWVYIFLSQMYFNFVWFLFNDSVLDHVIKLFFVLYRALKHEDLGWMLCVSGLWCNNNYFLSYRGIRRAIMREPQCHACGSWMGTRCEKFNFLKLWAL